MGRWLARLAAEERNTKTPPDETFETLKTGSEEVSKVLKVSRGGEYEKTSEPDRPQIQAGTGPKTPALPFDQRPTDWIPEPGPGITILRPAVEVEAREYDAHLDAMIAALPAGSAEAQRMTFAKRKGWCVDRGGERIYVKGRI